MPADEPAKTKPLPLVWVGADELPVYFLNQFLGQADRNEIYLTLGQLVPPAIFGATDEERAQELEAIDYVAVRPIVRLGFTPERLRELIDVLERTMAMHERAGDQDSSQE